MMRTITYKLLACWCCFCIAFVGHTEKGDSVAITRQITKVYFPFKNQLVFINNQFGDVTVNSWSKRQVSIKISITANAPSSGEAKELLKRVQITDTKADTAITCSTVIEGSDTTVQLNKLGQGKCSISYTVFMPENTPLKIKNRFGNINVGNYSGPLQVDEKFGNFTGRRLLKLVNLNLTFGAIKVANISSGALFAEDFGSVKIDTIAGSVNARVSLGKQVDVGVVNGNYNLYLSSANVDSVRLHLVKAFAGDIAINTKMSPVLNFSAIALKKSIDTASINITGRDDSLKRKLKTVTLQLKNDSTHFKVDASKIKLLKDQITVIRILGKATSRYTSSTTGPAHIKISAAFSSVTLKD